MDNEAIYTKGTHRTAGEECLYTTSHFCIKGSKGLEATTPNTNLLGPILIGAAQVSQAIHAVELQYTSPIVYLTIVSKVSSCRP